MQFTLGGCSGCEMLHVCYETRQQMMFVLHMLAVVDIRGLTAIAVNPYMNPMHGRHEIAESEICSLER